MPDALAKKVEAKEGEHRDANDAPPVPPGPAPLKQEASLVQPPPQQSGSLEVRQAWDVLRDAPALRVGDQTLSVKEGLQMANDFGGYISGTAGLMRWMQRLVPGLGGEPERPKKRCVACDRGNESDAVFCAGCGERLPKIVQADFRVMASEVAVEEVRRDAR